MSLSCECYDDCDWYYDTPCDFSLLQTKKRKRCVSCRKLINIGSIVVEFERWRAPLTDIEEQIEGDQVYLANQYMCEICGDIYFSLAELGFCVNLGESMQELLEQYHDLYLSQ